MTRNSRLFLFPNSITSAYENGFGLKGFNLLLVKKKFVNRYSVNPDPEAGMNLDFILAHEAWHVIHGSGHTRQVNNLGLTPNDYACSGLSAYPSAEAF